MNGLLNPWTMAGAGLLSTQGQLDPSKATFGAGLSNALNNMLGLEQFNLKKQAVDENSAIRRERLDILRGDRADAKAATQRQQQAIQGLLSGIPEEQRPMMANLLQVDPKAAIGLLTAQPKDSRTSAEKEYERARSQGFQGSFLDYQQALARARRTNVSVTNNNNSPYKPETQAGKLAADIAYWEGQQPSELKQETLDSLYRKRRMEGRSAENMRATDRMAAAADIADEFNETANKEEGGVGPLEGSVTRAKMDDGMIGRVIRTFSTPTAREAELSAMEAQMKALLGTALSGAAIPATEWPTYQAQLPSVVDTSATRKAKAQTFRRMMDTLSEIKAGKATKDDLDKTLTSGESGPKVIMWGQQ